jgi:hypothetical protein
MLNEAGQEIAGPCCGLVGPPHPAAKKTPNRIRKVCREMRPAAQGETP